MKRLILTTTLCCSFLIGYAQLAKWLVKPAYDGIEVKADNSVIATDSAGTTVLWNFEGKRLFQTSSKVLSYKEGHALVVNKDEKTIVGIVDLKGAFTSIPQSAIIYGSEFRDGYVAFVSDSKYGYISKDGKRIVLDDAARAWPVHDGLAPVLKYQQPDKRKDPYFCYYSPQDKNVSYTAKGKPFSPEDIMFLSGVNKDGKGIAVIKNKLFWFSAGSMEFEPIIKTDGQTVKEHHLVVDGDYEQYFEHLPNSGVRIKAKIGKKGSAYFTFTEELVPDTIMFNGDVHVTAADVEAKVRYKSDFGKVENGGKHGLAYKGKDFLPCQFEAIGLLYDKCAFVKTRGKWGILKAYDDLDLRLSINKGDDIPFRHQKFETQIRLDLPSSISADEARIEIPMSSGCVIDKTSREKKDTESGNFVQYNCTLNIPDSLPDVITTISYPFTVSYDGITLFERKKDVRAWHYKYYNVDHMDSETTISNGVATFTVNINAEKLVGENDYPFEISVQADNISATYEKISETRYKCTVSNLQEGNNTLNICVIEKGCPPSVFPFEITYVKPVPKKKKQESVVIRKKSPVVSGQKKVVPRLEI